MPEYLMRLVQVHESFRKAELQALAELAGVDMEFVSYSEDSPFCIISLASPAAARALITRSILSQAIYELWGHGSSLPALHASVLATSPPHWPSCATTSFRFTLDSYRGSRSTASQTTLIESFSYLPFTGPIQMRNPTHSFRIFEDYALGEKEPRYLYLGRFIADSGRQAKTTYDLKKRSYISTTSMDAELALVTANLSLAGPGKLFYDPFMGTGGFPVAAAHFGAVTLGSDIDGRSIRGKEDGKNVLGNFKQYNLTDHYLDSFVSDLTNSPVRGCLGPSPLSAGNAPGGWLDGIICDPPYGVREGLKVLGIKEGRGEWRKEMHLDRWQDEGYIPPKRPYSFEAMLDDIMHFAAVTLVEGGRLGMWMPSANDQDIELDVPTHPFLEVVSVCVQPFNKWSRKLLTYRRLPSNSILTSTTPWIKRREDPGLVHANDLNSFRKKYFEGFREKEPEAMSSGPLAEDAAST